MGSSEASMANVIGDNDLLHEILLRLGFPAFLVRAALVSKRWRGLAADPKFLRRFRDRHPPNLLGFYVHDARYRRQQFVPAVSEAAPELHVAVSDPSAGLPVDCQNGRLLLKVGEFHYLVRRPLCPAQGAVPILPPPQLPVDWVLPTPLQLRCQSACLLSRDSSDSVVFVYLLLGSRKKLSVQVYVLQQSGVWGEAIVAEGELHALSNDLWVEMVAHGKLNMACDNGWIHGLDFAAPRPRFFTIKLPDEVGVDNNYELSSGDDGGFFLIHGERFQLSVWHHETDDKGEDSWELVDRFCVRVARDRWEKILVLRAGDNAEFVFLGLRTSSVNIICVDLRSRKETVYEVRLSLARYINVFPFMAVWPPVFPVLNDEDDQGE